MRPTLSSSPAAPPRPLRFRSLRAAYPRLPFVGVVPAIKPAARRLAFGTDQRARDARHRRARLYPRARARARRRLRGDAGGFRWLAPDRRARRCAAKRSRMRRSPARSRPASSRRTGRRTDCVVLACTHFPLLIEALERLAPWPVTFVDPAPAIARRLDSLLGEPPTAPRRDRRRRRSFSPAARPPQPRLAKGLASVRFDVYALGGDQPGHGLSGEAPTRRPCDHSSRSRAQKRHSIIGKASAHAHIGRSARSSRRLPRPGFSHRFGRTRRFPRPQCDARRVDARDPAQSGRTRRTWRSLSTATSCASFPPNSTARRSRPPISRRAPRNSCCRARRAAPFTLQDRDPPRSGRQHQADGALSLRLRLLHAMRGRGLPPHRLFSRSPRRAVDLSRAARGRSRGGAGSARQRQSRKLRRGGRPRDAIGRSGPIRTRSPAICSRLVAGDLAHISDSFVTASGRKVALAIYVEPGREERAHYAMDALKRAMAWDERAYGREYDLDVFNIVAVSDFNMGAMENKGLNVFNDKYVLASPETATDDDYAGIEGVIAHEYFHNWTGNRITCRDWFQLCLKEGLTVFRDQEFSADMRSAPVKRIAEVRALRAAQFPEDAGPLAHNVRPEVYNEISNFYTATVYQKGAEVIRMLKRLIGAGRRSAPAWTSISSATTARRRRSRSSSAASPMSPAATSTASCAGTRRRARRRSRSAAPMIRPRADLSPRHRRSRSRRRPGRRRNCR